MWNSKQTLRPQKMLKCSRKLWNFKNSIFMVYIVDMIETVDIVDIVKAICNKARFELKQSRKC